MDRLTTERRSALMSRIRTKDTMPELLLRRAVHGEAYRYRLHVKNLPGSPDLVFPTRKKVIFVHGCIRKLRRMGWRVLVVWHCSLKAMNGCLQRVISFLER